MSARTTKVNTSWDDYEKNLKKKPQEFKYEVKKPEYTYDDSTREKYYNELLNRKDFSFDLNNNALYNQYKDTFSKQGQLAMMDTVGQAAAMTGGFGNSYAASAGQQAYQQNLDKLNEVVPEIYQLALEQYQMEGQNLLDKYGVAAAERDTAYGMYRDEKADYYTDQEIAYGQYRDEMADWQYDNAHLYDRYTDQRDFAYQQERDDVADWQWEKNHAETVRMNDHNIDIDNKNYLETVRMNDHNIYIDEENLNLDKSKFKHQQTIDNRNQNREDQYLQLDKDKFAHTVTVDNRNQDRDDQYLKLDKDKFAHTVTVDNKEYQLKVKQLAEEARRFDKTHSLNEREFSEMCKQWAKEYGLDEQKLKEDIRQFNANLEEEQRQYDSSLAEDKRQFNMNNNKTEDGGLDQKSKMNLLAEFGLLTENNVVDALTNFDGFLKKLTGGDKTTKTDNALSKQDEVMVDYIAGRINDMNIANDPSAIKALFDELERTKSITKEQRALFDEYFLN